MIKVFLPDKTIFLIDDNTLYQYHQNSIFVGIQSIDEMQTIYPGLANQNHIHEIYFFNKDIEQLFQYFSSLFRIIEAAGGLVRNVKDKWLFIFRHGKWDLPKGKIEKKESIEMAAIREVEEECGIGGLTITRELVSTYHIYSLKDKIILKRTYWFEMLCTDTSKLVPQLEEGITDAKWLDTGDLKQVYENTYESIKEVLKEMETA